MKQILAIAGAFLVGIAVTVGVFAERKTTVQYQVAVYGPESGYLSFSIGDVPPEYVTNKQIIGYAGEQSADDKIVFIGTGYDGTTSIYLTHIDAVLYDNKQIWLNMP